jgi:hypothetical protein
MATRFDAKLYLPKFAHGWGDLFGKNPGKLAEDYMILKSVQRVKMINKFS